MSCANETFHFSVEYSTTRYDLMLACRLLLVCGFCAGLWNLMPACDARCYLRVMGVDSPHTQLISCRIGTRKLAERCDVNQI